jgi:hypothetical protein
VRRHRPTRVSAQAVLWGGAPPRRPAENLATLVSRLRSALGPDVIVGGRGGYRLGPTLEVDLIRGERLLAEADRQLTAGEAAHAWRRHGTRSNCLTGTSSKPNLTPTGSHPPGRSTASSSGAPATQRPRRSSTPVTTPWR